MGTQPAPGGTNGGGKGAPPRHRKDSFGARMKRTLLPVLAVLVALLIAYGAGYLVASSKAKQVRADSARQVRDAQAARAKDTAHIHLLSAQAALYTAAIDLEQRNFGEAGDSVQRAKEALDRVDPTAAGVDPRLLATLRQSVAGVQIQVTSDLQSERTQLLDLAQQAGRLAGRLAGGLASG